MQWVPLIEDYNHVCNPEFRSLPLVNGTTPKDELLKTAFENLQRDDADAISYIEADQLLRQAYQTVMGIHDYDKDPDVFNIVAAHANEDTFLTSRRCRRMQEYYHASVNDVLHLNWSEFQKLPVPEADQAIAMSRMIKRIHSENQLLAINSHPQN